MAYDQIFSALSDPNRRAILERLRSGPQAGGALAQHFPISRPAVSQHLKVLVDAGLLSIEPCGARNLYALSPQGIDRLRDYTAALWDDALTAFETAAKTREQEINMALDQIEDIEKTLVVPVNQDEAFRIFTADLAHWWPVQSHSLSAGKKALPKDVEVEPREGGQILETLPDGTKSAWARITTWAPGQRLALNWHVGREEADATTLDVRFLPHPAGCEVHLTHGGWTALGSQAQAMAETYKSGWDIVLGHCFGGACKLRMAS